MARRGKWGKVDFRELEKFAKRMQQAQEENVFDQFFRDFLLEMARRAYNKMYKRTPVDTGQLRDNWQIGDVRKEGDTYIIEIFNETPYASFVEYGHRQNVGQYVPTIRKRLKRPWVEGRFFMTISANEIEQELPKYLDKRLDKLLREIIAGNSGSRK